jgi:hypothetical protein
MCQHDLLADDLAEQVPASRQLDVAAQFALAFEDLVSSWIATPWDVRSRGGALFCDRRYGKVFVCHNGAQS